jgi:muramoyltetrapeptide carboxypeptidase LdcA involved in peptidoglycan recycling
MKPRYPAPLRAGSRVFVAAPSSGVAERLWPRLDLVIAHLREQGFVVEEGALLRRQGLAASGTAAERAEELMSALLRTDVDAIFPPWGGRLAIELLELLDWDAIARARPKWFAGFSDLSTLMLPLLLRSGWASAHALNLMDRAPAQSDALSLRSLELLQVEAGQSVEQRSSDSWQKTWGDFVLDPAAPFGMTEPTRYWTLFGEQEVHARGRILAGCLDTCMHLVGTPYGDIPGWRARSSEDGCLLWLENCNLAPAVVVRALRQMRYAGWLDGLAALLLGRSAAAVSEENGLRYEQALRQSLVGLPYPVLVDVDFGHAPPQFTLVQGALAELTWSTNGARLVQTLV